VRPTEQTETGQQEKIKAMDATRVLVAQHRAIETLFEEVDHERRRRRRASAVSRLAEELIVHMAAEEAVFYPMARRVLDEGSDASDQGRSEHLLLRIELRRMLETSVSEAAFDQRIEVLRALFAQHVREEESNLFPRVASQLTHLQLETLGVEILASRPPVWVVTGEERALVHSGDEWALRSRISLPIPPSRGE
jgi:hemerythrin superfamily protein